MPAERPFGTLIPSTIACPLCGFPTEISLKRVWLWWSTGKDSAWSLHVLNQNPEVIVERLVSTVTPTFSRVAIHGTRISLLQAQAAAGLPLQTVELPYPCSNAAYESAIAPVLAEAASTGSTMAFGDLFLEDVRQYREVLLSRKNVPSLFPLWGLEFKFEVQRARAS